ncbi:hypothetical protein HQ80_0061 [Dickeya phage phiD3]|uniref:Uncharacterized protein n=1 Tax=Dickeya phage phiD3 TaxID=1542131 RepID=A0A0N6W240_9CAUD|nr:hypothetical protein HQ80_0061 [Dickeya phage phiD3]
MNYPLDAKFILPRKELDTFRVLHQLLVAGETIPVYEGGKKVGKGVSCAIEDSEYWAFDFNRTENFKPRDSSMMMRFMIDKPIDLQKYDLFLDAIPYEFREDGLKYRFALLVCFKMNIVLKPMFTPPNAS